MSEDRKKELRCSFCGKSEHEVHRMIQGPGVRICDECVRLCIAVLQHVHEIAGTVCQIVAVSLKKPCFFLFQPAELFAEFIIG